MANRVNITPILEQIMGVSQIKSKEDLEKLISALRKMGDDELTTKEMAEIAEAINTDKAVSP